MVEIFAQHYHARTPKWTIEQLIETAGDDTMLDDTMQSWISTAPTIPVPTMQPCWLPNLNVDYDPCLLTIVRESKCLEEGTYHFTIYNDPLFYNVTSYGNVIAEGYEPGYKESTSFQVPFT